MVALNAMAWLGCESEETPEPVDCNENPVVLELVAVQDADCNSKNGSVEVAASGGSGNYSFKIGNGAGQKASVFNGLGAGLYEITAIDDKDCTTTIEANVKNKNGMNISVQTSEAGCKTSNGSITVTATGGTEPYEFKLDNGTFGSSGTFSGLESGQHTILAKDASGCEVNQGVKVRTGVSFAGSISGIIQNNCAVSNCHSGTQSPDFRQFKNIQDNAGQIKTLTQNGTMPQEGVLTQEQKDLIACWVDDGAPNN